MYNSLILETISLKIVNKIITQSLIYKREIKTYIRYLSEGRITKYFNCQKYRYIARRYRNLAKYAECTKDYNTNTYTKEPETRQKYIICNGNHRAGSIYCLAKRREREKTTNIRNLILF